MKTLCLTMIVKNESHIITKCFDSIVDYLDYWVISDTGSTDGTQTIIRDYFKQHGIPGELHETPWKNFGYNRTVAFVLAKLALLRQSFDYYFVMDADDQLKGSLAVFKKSSEDVGAYYINIKLGSINYKRLQIFNTRHRWKYVGVLHEYPTSDTANIVIDTIPDCYIEAGVCGDRTTSTTDKYLKDAEILLKGIQDEPDNTRYYFYIAQSYYDAGDYQNAMKYYEKRRSLGGWIEEVYYSMFRYAMSKYQLSGKMDEVQDDFIKAHQHHPTRLEALFMVVDYYRIHDPKTGYIYGKCGYSTCLTYPTDVLFVNVSIHRYKFIDSLAVCAYYAGEHSQAIQLNWHLIKLSKAGEIGIDIDRIRKNMGYSITTNTQLTTAFSDNPTEGCQICHDIINQGGVNQSLIGLATTYLLDNTHSECGNLSSSHNKPILCFYMGYSNINYNGGNYIEMNVGESEIAAINLAICLTKHYRVFFCGQNIRCGNHGGVEYTTPEHLHIMLGKSAVEILIISRYIHYFTEFRNTAKQVYIWLHDVTPLPWLNGGSINNTGYNLIYNQRHQINRIICLSEWHMAKIQGDAGLDRDKFCVIGNGLNNSDFTGRHTRILNRFIYCSSASHSLNNILDIFPNIVREIPTATLHIYTEIDDGFQQRIDKMDYVVCHGRIPHDQVVPKFQESDVWLYIPDTFCETYCICALEAQRAGCLCFVNHIGSLPNNVGDRGVVFKDGDDRVKIIAESLSDPEFVRERRHRMQEWSVEQTWENRTQQWIHQFNNCQSPVEHNNNKI